MSTETKLLLENKQLVEQICSQQSKSLQTDLQQSKALQTVIKHSKSIQTDLQTDQSSVPAEQNLQLVVRSDHFAGFY